MGDNDCCRGCKERKLYCHSTCDKYISFLKKREEIRDAKVKYYNTQEYFFDKSKRIKSQDAKNKK